MQLSHYSGSGNSFLIVSDSLPITSIGNLCRSHKADGLIVATRQPSKNYLMEIYNADGSNPKMCGNGLRCLAKYLFDRGLIENKGIVETACGPFRVALRENLIEVEMPTPKLLARDLKITYGNHHFSGHHILVGVPHFVIKSCPIPFVEAAPHLRSHPYFGAEGTNVTFIQGSLTQTFERGVEAITGACGTGTVASFKALQLEEPKIHQKSFTTHSKEILEVKRVEDRFFLNGGVTLLFDAEF